MSRGFTLAGALAAGLVFVPVLPGFALIVPPLLQSETWLAVWQDSQWPEALMTTLVSTTLSVGGALLLTLILLCTLYPGERWQRYLQRLPLLLALPHVALASGFFFLFSASGWLARLFNLSLPPDNYGFTLGLMLALKEAWFLLWFSAAQLQSEQLSQQITFARTLGYGELQSRLYVLVPQLLPRLGWALVAVTAYSLSVVDAALILGPANPPTFAVLAWQWLTDSDISRQDMGLAASCVLLLLLGGFMVFGRLAWEAFKLRIGRFSGKRCALNLTSAGTVASASLSLFGFMALAMLVIWSFAEGWFYPARWPESLTLSGWQQAELVPVWTSFVAGLISALIAPVVTILWLKGCPRRYDRWLYLPLLLPALPLAAGQYQLLLRLNMEGSWAALIWSHLLWVVPYTLLILAPAWQRIDARLVLTAQTFGWSPGKILCLIQIPLLVRPLLAALAVGFSVSIAQYLPTLYAGAGRFATVTTEAVALSSGGDPQQFAIQALLQMLLPLAVFIATISASRLAGTHRKGLR
ncbi:ABC transporter permease [Enterobacter sp. Ap-916]|uniref:ABC transporter permease n=1 Tax=unclassified Enterobacter TaxID=2608935 RepID=UPI001421361F|nr:MULTISPECIES: ABC transporter permease [unclassified Enterobacter]NIF59043.1 ABC transporter permease [Enterobacter sp. Ap-867]NIG29541.1 ABC transporter permease [Enterobacter sp. Ap-916]